MFSNFESSGRHLLIDIRGIKNIDLICNKEAIFNLMNAVCEELDLGILNKNHFQFNNGAITAIYMLRESHISLSVSYLFYLVRALFMQQYMRT
jgi:S-adenosylmethionine/arginine decarboxylase-like enzyme